MPLPMGARSVPRAYSESVTPLRWSASPRFRLLIPPATPLLAAARSLAVIPPAPVVDMRTAGPGLTHVGIDVCHRVTSRAHASRTAPGFGTAITSWLLLNLPADSLTSSACPIDPKPRRLAWKRKWRPTGERASSASTRARRPSNPAARAAATAGWRTSPASCEPRRRSRRSDEVKYGNSARRASKTTRG